LGTTPCFFALSLNEPGHNEPWRIKTAWQPLQQNDLKGDKKNLFKAFRVPAIHVEQAKIAFPFGKLKRQKWFEIILRK
jgi:hypothetical protein